MLLAKALQVFGHKLLKENLGLSTIHDNLWPIEAHERGNDKIDEQESTPPRNVDDPRDPSGTHAGICAHPPLEGLSGVPKLVIKTPILAFDIFIY